jgi:uncharacterized protein YecE (DUF72 family)
MAEAERQDEPAPARGLVGVSSWRKDEWRGAFYPPDLAQARELAFLAARVPTIEINATFHGRQPASSFLKWRDGVPDAFVFSVKAAKAITHDRPLRGAEREIAAFLAGPLLLGDKLGPILWQFPPSFSFDPGLVDDFLAGLPRSTDEARRFIRRHGGEVDGELARMPDRPLRHSMEVRSPSFVQPRYVELLRAHGVAAVLSNVESRPVFDEVTADFVYVRFTDGLEHYPDGVGDAGLEAQAARVRSWLEGSGAAGVGRDVFFYFDDPDHSSTHPPFDAIALQRLVGGESPAAGATLQASLW